MFADLSLRGNRHSPNRVWLQKGRRGTGSVLLFPVQVIGRRAYRVFKDVINVFALKVEVLGKSSACGHQNRGVVILILLGSLEVLV